MQDTLSESLRRLKQIKIRRVRMVAILLVLSLVVSLDVFWVLRQPGLTLAGDASCGIVEHTHDDSCNTPICICTQSDAVHVHSEACYETHYVAAQENTFLACQLPETAHTHGDGCYETVLVGVTQETKLACENTDETHIHEDTCYITVETGGWEESQLICQLSTEPHQHTDSCYDVELIDAHEERSLVCGLSEESHTHEDSCYEWTMTCALPEHTHTIDCYADTTADVETLLDWQKMFADYPFTDDLREDLVGIALTQVGYTESTLNFAVGEDGIRRGYTRYGAWYGMPYQDWSAMFVSFCLNYAGADPEETPGNSGADSMAEAWKKLEKYQPAGEYIPLPGDLVFFDDNTVGIVSEVRNATFYVIRGDHEDAVTRDMLYLDDESIVGWGITEEPEPEETIPEEEIPETIPQTGLDPPVEYDGIPDISNGPVLRIYEGGIPQPMMRRATTWSTRTTYVENMDLLAYLADNGGSYFFTLLDTNDDGQYIVYPNTGYILSVSFHSENGFLPGTYWYNTPSGLMVDGGTGKFVLQDGTEVGKWEVTDNGFISLEFNEHINSRSDITISATMGIHFPQSEDPIEFDGKITVTVETPPQQIQNTVVTKWGIQGSETLTGKTDPTKLYWNVSITGRADSQIVGAVLTDKLISGEWIGDQRYTESDMEQGLRFGVSDPNGEWHAWNVYPGDPNLTWTEQSWSYTMPQSITCWCGEVFLGNEGWVYYIDYSTTPDKVTSAGQPYYMNRFMVDNQYADGGANFTHGEILGEVYKNGAFVSDAGGGAFQWEFQVLVPAMKADQKAEYYWYLMDYMYLVNEDGQLMEYVTNDANLATVTANYYGTTIPVPNIRDATAADPFAWENAWSPTAEGIEYGRQISILCRCHCNAQNCQHWYEGYGCGSMNGWYEGSSWHSSGFCNCWTETSDTLFTFSYDTTDLSVIKDYGSLNYRLQNVVELYYKPDGGNIGYLVSNDHVAVPVPNLFGKELNHEFDGYIASYTVTVNEAKLVLTNGAPLTIHDVMTNTLAYISGSLVITTEDAGGNTATLQQGVDYTVEYDGTGNQTDQNGKEVHVLDIVILHPQPVMYILDYDTTLIMPNKVTEGIKYSNAAHITLWGEDISENVTEKVHADINIAAKSFKVQMIKTSAETGEPLGGATFGLFNENGGLIYTEVTNEKGELNFQTNVIEGVVLREHVLYYMQELRAPPGYQLDDTPYWFCFCDTTNAYCETCNQVLEGKDGTRIPFEQIGRINISNHVLSYDLPATGGPGIYPLMLVSVMFIVTPLVYGFIRGRKRERRGVG